MAGVAGAVVISIYVTAPHTLTPPSGGLDGAGIIQSLEHGLQTLRNDQGIIYNKYRLSGHDIRISGKIRA